MMIVPWKFSVCILSSLVLCLGGTDGFDVTIGDIHEILSFGREVITDILESYELVKPHQPNDENDYPFVKKMEKRLMDKMSTISQNIDDLEDRLDLHMEAVMSNIIETITVDQSLDNTLRQFDHYVGQIENMYDNAVEYARAREKFEDYTIEKFAMACTSPNIDDLPNVIKTMHRLVVSSPTQIFNRSLIVLLAKQMQEASSQICNLQQSPQQLLYNLYKTITLTEIKGYSMIQFSYVLLRIYHPGSNFWEEMQLVKQQFNNRAAETLRAVKTAMAFAPRDIWRCDPKKHVANETYTELKQLFQGYIVNEVDLNGDNTCRETCSYYTYAKVYGCYKNQYCAQQRRCNGKIVNCEYIDSDMWICPSTRSNARRYEWIQYENGKTFGKKNGSCPRPTTKVDSWWRWLFWHCSYCFCYCDDHNSNSDRYFNLRKVESDIENNKVITGIRLLKKNQIIHMQIQEGELLPRGGINSSSIGWKPVEDYTVFDHNVKSGVDYHTLVWEKRALDMDDLVPPQDHLLTGVRFRMIGTRLNLEIRITPFNFTSGKLIQPLDKSYWYSNDVTERTELPLKRPDLPIRTTLENVPDSSINQYLNFAPSDKEKDAAQSTIPFLDIQPVTINPPVPIAGAGIFHKGRPSSGGFVALKLFTYNFGPHLQSEPAPEEPIFDSIHNEIRAV